ncbi:CBS domain-containing protein [Halorubrum lacusprofundi]|jgi:CBS domain-containing protein|uniref:Signal transduction protein with CBS domains n=1 Tax=Halorubrum lacusprofundi (strain ATCC 49239 / DSM 5036 / JCM 8891 / ACAM 34) TaxID=416348 RepID=B9LV14_HALLT|nr:CBS domain-containing protein [Halorubrum lacusprofundi]ACM56491.1 putative signal transduction protein with CBS domains [Halorubrum lacusprofundi ATCC 49239]MCG1005237.1 CBS domain-containing protein [Halorubrum lacusprofundi]
MADIPIERLMSTELVTIDPGAAAADAANRMLETGVSSILVVDDDGHLAGLITATDFVSLVRRNDPEDETPVEAFMTTDIVTVSPDDSVEELAEPTDRGYTHLPVVTADSKLVGIVSTTDLTTYVSEQR